MLHIICMHTYAHIYNITLESVVCVCVCVSIRFHSCDFFFIHVPFIILTHNFLFFFFSNPCFCVFWFYFGWREANQSIRRPLATIYCSSSSSTSLGFTVIQHLRFTVTNQLGDIYTRSFFSQHTHTHTHIHVQCAQHWQDVRPKERNASVCCTHKHRSHFDDSKLIFFLLLCFVYLFYNIVFVKFLCGHRTNHTRTICQQIDGVVWPKLLPLIFRQLCTWAVSTEIVFQNTEILMRFSPFLQDEWERTTFVEFIHRFEWNAIQRCMFCLCFRFWMPTHSGDIWRKWMAGPSISKFEMLFGCH